MNMDANVAILREVTDLVSEFASRFDRASMDGPTPERGAGMRLELSCSAPGTARAVFYPDDDEINVFLAQATWMELFKRKRQEGPERVREVRRILEAVVNGRFEETIWRVKGTTVRSKSVLYAADGEAFLKSSGWQRLTWLDPRAKGTRIKYEAYS